MNYYLDVLKKYVVFEGRAARKEYWMFAIFNIIIGVILTLIGRLISFNSPDVDLYAGYIATRIGGYVPSASRYYAAHIGYSLV